MAQNKDTANQGQRMFKLEPDDFTSNPRDVGYIHLSIVTEVHLADTFAHVFVSSPCGMRPTSRACGEALIALMNGGTS